MLRTIVLVALLAGGVAGGIAQEAQFAYVASDNSQSLLGYKINRVTGEFTPVPGSPYATGQYGNSLIVVDPLGRFVYVVGGNTDVLGYKIDAISGRLTPISPSPLPLPLTEGLALDPSGKYAYAVRATQGVYLAAVYTYRVDPATGQLILIPGTPLPTGANYSSIMVDPLGKFVYTPNLTAENISGFTINPANGTLTPIAGSPFPANVYPQSISIDSMDRFAYVGTGGSTDAFSIDGTTGALTPLSPPSYLAGIGVEATVDPRGKFLYVASTVGIYGFNIAQFNSGPGMEAGSLTALAGSPFVPASSAGDLYPVSVVVDYTGTFAYAAYYLGGIVGFKINGATGVPTAVPGPSFDSGGSPPTIAIARPHTTPIYSARQVPQPAFGPYASFTGSAINNRGWVTGQAVLVGSENLSETFLYNGTTTSGIFLPGSATNTGNSINDKGEIVGTYTPPGIGGFLDLTQAFLIRSPGVTFQLDTRAGGQSTASSINNDEHITGTISTGVCTFAFGLGCTSAAGLGNTHGFLDTGEGPKDIGTLGGNFSEGNGINEHDEVTGGSNVTANGPNHVFVYSHRSFHDLGKFDGQSSVGTAINDRGWIIGNAVAPSGTQTGFLHHDGWFERLPALDGGTGSVPSGINLQGDVVGTSTVGSGGPNHAFLYTHGKLVDLNDLVEPSLTLLTGATGINDKGQIVANGLNGGVYVLTPICDDVH